MGPGNKSRDESPETGRVSLFPIRCVNVVGQARGGQQSVWRLLRRRLGAIALQHGVDESEALLEAVERHEGAHARAFLLPQQNLVERLEPRSEEHTSELQSLMRNSYAVFCLKKKTNR